MSRPLILYMQHQILYTHNYTTNHYGTFHFTLD